MAAGARKQRLVELLAPFGALLGRLLRIGHKRPRSRIYLPQSAPAHFGERRLVTPRVNLRGAWQSGKPAARSPAGAPLVSGGFGGKSAAVGAFGAFGVEHDSAALDHRTLSVYLGIH